MEVIHNLHLIEWATKLEEYRAYLVYEFYAHQNTSVLKKNDPWFHKVYIREHFVTLSASMIANWFPYDMHTEFDNEDNIDINKLVTTVSQGLIRTKHKGFAAKYINENIGIGLSFVSTTFILLLTYQLLGIRCSS